MIHVEGFLDRDICQTDFDHWHILFGSKYDKMMLEL